MSQKIKQIIIAVVVIFIAFFGFKMFFSPSSPSDATLSADGSTQQFVDGQAVLTLLNRLNKVTLNDAIFSNPVFNSLISFEQEIPDQDIGRNNPFSIIGNDNGSSAVNVPSAKATSTPKTH